jgi:hypothetical protein
LSVQQNPACGYPETFNVSSTPDASTFISFE